MAVSNDLLEILRCPYCVSGETRKAGEDPGQLELVRDGKWLVCEESDCHRKYPIKEDIPVMLIDEGDKWRDTAIEDLSEPGPLVEERPKAASPHSAPAATETGPDLFMLVGATLAGILGLLFLYWLLKPRRS